MAPLFLQATRRKADHLGETKKEGHEQLTTDRPCRCLRPMTLISSARTPVDGESDGEVGGLGEGQAGVEWLRSLTAVLPGLA